MAKVRVRDDAIWLKHIEDDPRLGKRILAMSAGDVVNLEVNGVVGPWQRMRDGRDGRPTLGIKPVAAMKDVWARLRREATGQIVEIRTPDERDTYLEALTPLMAEWDTAEDEEAYRDL